MVGNLSNFTKIDILRCLLKIEKPISRSELSKTLNLGEGTIRSILDILHKKGFLASNKQGHYLSRKGTIIAKEIKNNISMEEVDLNNIFSGKKKIAVHIKNPGKISKSYALRDEAVKNGADGALILNYDKKLRLCDLDYKQDFSGIEDKFDLAKNDLVIITYADSYKLAEHGALAVATELNSSLNNIMKRLK